LEGIGFYVLLMAFYAITAILKKKQKAAARKAKEIEGDEGPVTKQMPDLFRELFGLPPENKDEDQEPKVQDEQIVQEEQGFDIFGEEIPQYEENMLFEEESGPVEEFNEFSSGNLEIALEEAIEPEKFPHQIGNLKINTGEHGHSREASINQHLILSHGRVQDKLSKRNELRDAIILSEILGKPKALRKRR